MKARGTLKTCSSIVDHTKVYTTPPGATASSILGKSDWEKRHKKNFFWHLVGALIENFFQESAKEIFH